MKKVRVVKERSERKHFASVVLTFFIVIGFLFEGCFAGITTVTGLSIQAGPETAYFVGSTNPDSARVAGFGTYWTATLETEDGVNIQGKTIGFSIKSHSNDNMPTDPYYTGPKYIDKFSLVWTKQSNKGKTDASASTVCGIGYGNPICFQLDCDEYYTTGPGCPDLTNLKCIGIDNGDNTNGYYTDANVCFFFKQIGKAITANSKVVISFLGTDGTLCDAVPWYATSASNAIGCNILSNSTATPIPSLGWNQWTPSGYIPIIDEIPDWFDNDDPNEPYDSISNCWPYVKVVADINNGPSFTLYSYDTSNNVVDACPIEFTSVNGMYVSDNIMLITDYKYKGIKNIGTTSTGTPGGKYILILGVTGGHIEIKSGNYSHISNLVDLQILAPLLGYDLENFAAFCDDYLNEIGWWQVTLD